MGINTNIEWADRTWNPVTGCTRVSAGCDNCYAVGMTKRLEAMGQVKYLNLVNEGKSHFNGTVRYHEEELGKPLRWKKAQRIFVNSMSDLFHKEVPFEFIDRVLLTIAQCPQHTFMVLTKRPERMAEYFDGITSGSVSERLLMLPRYAEFHSTVLNYRRGTPLANLWLGTSVENQATANERIPHLLKVPAAVRFLSCEPLLGPVDFRKVPGFNKCGQEGVDLVRNLWVIAGGESGPNARPMHPDWARSLRDQCQAAGVPFFFKQWGEYLPWYEFQSSGVTDNYESSKYRVSIWNDDESEFEDYGFQSDESFDDEVCPMGRVGKKKAGRVLDGREWSEFPK